MAAEDWSRIAALDWLTIAGESRVMRIDAGIDVSHNSSAGDLKLALSGRDVNDVCCRLIDVTVPNGRSVIRDWSRVGEGGGRYRHPVQAAEQADQLVQFCIHDSRERAQKLQERRRIQRTGDEE